MRKFSRLLNRFFPDISGRIWVDLYSLAALIRFAQGLPVDAAVLIGVLGIYAGSKAVNKMSTKDEAN